MAVNRLCNNLTYQWNDSKNYQGKCILFDKYLNILYRGKNAHEKRTSADLEGHNKF